MEEFFQGHICSGNSIGEEESQNTAGCRSKDAHHDTVPESPLQITGSENIPENIKSQCSSQLCLKTYNDHLYQGIHNKQSQGNKNKGNNNKKQRITGESLKLPPGFPYEIIHAKATVILPEEPRPASV
jgi:hypothetical protein